MAPSVLGLAVTQLNVLVSTFLASYLPEGSISYLYFADRLLEFPMGIFAIAVATAVLPVMSSRRPEKNGGICGRRFRSPCASCFLLRFRP